jgi:hypothetical protein
MQDGRDLVLSRTLKAIHKAIKDSGKPTKVVRGVAMGHSGVIDADKALGTILSSPGLTSKNTRPPRGLFRMRS